MPQQTPNDSLSALLDEAGWSRKACARALREAAAARGADLLCDHTAVKRWLDGTAPRASTAQLMTKVFGARLNRPVALADLGLKPPVSVDATVGAIYPTTAEDAAGTIAALWQADIEGLSDVVRSAVDTTLWADAPLSWLIRQGRDQLVTREWGRLVGLAEVEAIKATTSMFARLDNEFGGEHARPVFIRYLVNDVAPLLHGRYGDGVGRRLHAASAEACLLVAWMSYDCGAHGLAQRYFTQGLRLAQAADDELLAASILDAMSHQATFLGRFHHAANLARAARAGTERRQAPRLRAHFLAMEARALAGTGNGATVERLLGESSEIHARGHSGDDPDWIGYFDDAELAAEHAHCLRDLGVAGRSAAQAAVALSPTGQSPRSDYFVLMVLGQAQVEVGDLDEGCATFRRATELRRRLRSGRCLDYERRARRTLAAHQGPGPVRDLLDETGWARAAA